MKPYSIDSRISEANEWMNGRLDGVAERIREIGMKYRDERFYVFVFNSKPMLCESGGGKKRIDQLTLQENTE